MGRLTITLSLLFLFQVSDLFPQIKFACIGDFGDDNENELEVANLIDNYGVDFIITVGDNYYDAEDENYHSSWAAIDREVGQYYHEWIYPYQGTYGTGASENKFFPVPGNHDYYHLDSLDVYTDYFTLPNNERYYDFVKGNVHFFMLNTYGDGLTEYTFPRHGNYGEPDGVDSNSVQANWFYGKIADCTMNHGNHWKIVVHHIPPYSSGNHGSEPIVQWDYKAHGVHLVLAGHDHHYERLESDGVLYFVNGLGGEGIGGINSPIPESIFLFNGNYGAMFFETVGETQLIGKFIDVNETVQDSFMVEDSALPVELTSFTASVVNNSVMLNWRTETEVDNYGFQVERASLSASPRQGWEKIGFVNGSGNSNAPVSYTFMDENVHSGKYSYRLKQIDTDGDYEYSDVIAVDLGTPNEFELAQNFPNPFNPVTKIKYTIPSVIASETKQSLIILKVYDILGNEVATLVNEYKPAGSFEVEFNGSGLSSGMYFYQLNTENFTTVKKMILTK